ncbi:hypothetical protein RBI21_06855 [Klebsiella pneumoniae]|nr:hypothetical protein RBI21_06855 [Klebsiella pneumoniae]
MSKIATLSHHWFSHLWDGHIMWLKQASGKKFYSKCSEAVDKRQQPAARKL